MAPLVRRNNFQTRNHQGDPAAGLQMKKQDAAGETATAVKFALRAVAFVRIATETAIPWGIAELHIAETVNSLPVLQWKKAEPNPSSWMFSSLNEAHFLKKALVMRVNNCQEKFTLPFPFQIWLFQLQVAVVVVAWVGQRRNSSLQFPVASEI